MLKTEDLIGYQLAEYKAASNAKRVLLALQFLVALPAAISIFVESDAKANYLLALAGVLLLASWQFVEYRYRAHRNAAERTRRATLVLDGLGATLSPQELRELGDCFKVTPEAAKAAYVPNYFASSAPPGPRRLAHMVEESAYYTAALQRGSAAFMGFVFGGLVLLLLIGIAASVPFAAQPTLMVVARLFLVFLVFALSSDVLGAVRGHLETAAAAKDAYIRLGACEPRGYPNDDVLLIVGDYNAAAEASPLTVPWVFKLMRAGIARRWAAYQQAQAGGAAAGRSVP